MTQMHKKCKNAKNAKTAKKNITQMRSFLQNRKKRETEILTFCVITFKTENGHLSVANFGYQVLGSCKS